jgi:hypothetical protein
MLHLSFYLYACSSKLNLSFYLYVCSFNLFSCK